MRAEIGIRVAHAGTYSLLIDNLSLYSYTQLWVCRRIKGHVLSI